MEGGREGGEWEERRGGIEVEGGREGSEKRGGEELRWRGEELRWRRGREEGE